MRAGDTTLFPTDERSDWVAFEYGAPGPDLLPTQLLAAAAQHRLSQPDAHTSLQYGPVLGDLRFRRELAAFLTRQYGRESNPVVAENLCITNGASQSFSNLITLFAGPDTTIYIENPTYFLAIRVLEDHGIPRSDLVAVPVDANGIRVDVLEQRLQQAKPAKHRQSPEQPAPHPKRFANVLYLVPTYSNPTGATLPLERRRALVKLAREHDMLVICDDIYQMLHFEEPLAEAGSVELPRGSLPPPRIVALDPALDPESSEFGNIVSNGSFSKLLAPGLRVGWTEAPRGITRQLERSGLMYSGGCPSHLTSTLVLSALELGLVDPHVAMLRRVYAQRCGALCRALAANLPAGCEFALPSGGFFVWIKVELRPPLSTSDLARFLVESADLAPQPDGVWAAVPGAQSPIRAERVSVTPGNAFSTNGSHGSWLRLSFAMHNEDRLVEGAMRLCRVLQQLCE
ncbi:Valine--pyruvate aminotransferase [Polyrhizophydium stewartii]|uniref:Valine--pyruvate aminotransferase n=1 Tax=Polyrhizophydium stewartii TaxID=2732419 RepID=A0ABR4NAN0_9FUNG